MIKKFLIILGILLLGIGILLICILIFLAYEFPSPPPRYHSEQSPDGTWAVEVWWVANDAYPLQDGVDVIVVVKDAQGNELQRKRIDSRDRWEDVEKRYSEVIITNTEIKVGPHYWRYDPTNPIYYTIKKTDIDFKKFLDDKNKK